MVFKTDKNFVTKVAFRGFTPPQLLRQFCLRQKRFYGTTHCYDDRRTGLLFKVLGLERGIGSNES